MAFNLTTEMVGSTLLVAALALVIVNLMRVRPAKPPSPILGQSPSGPVFLFDETRLIDCSPAGRALLAQSASLDDEWGCLMAFLKPRFPKIEQNLSKIAELGSFSDVSHLLNGVATLLEATYSGGLTKITLSDPDMVDGRGVAMAIAHRAAIEELSVLRETISSAPILAWRENAEGDVIWANTRYLVVATDLAQRVNVAGVNVVGGRLLSWPLPRLFDRKASQQSAQHQRQSISIPNKAAIWYDLQTEAAGSDLLCFATPADRAVAAEASLQQFMQTLSKTFAQLPIGLAIFDKDRKLQIFNPALLDLTNLPADFLSMRPSLLSVLDAMRERNLLPEPKNYIGWRRQILDMEKAASSGLFQENWALADGQTFRVTGRPHPNGALALMIEDISTEMQRTRRYRADLELGHSVIDQMAEAIVVFGQSGQLMWSNMAYSQLWGHDPNATLAEASIRNLGDRWKALSAPSGIWLEIDEFVHTIGDRHAWTGELRLSDGRLIRCRIAPVAGGATMIAFALNVSSDLTALSPRQKARSQLQ
jgi:PAS domain-containing protein